MPPTNPYADLVGWPSQLLRRQLTYKPRSSPDEIPAARELWDLKHLPHLTEDLPALAQTHESVVLRTRGDTQLTADIYVPEGDGPFPTLVYFHGGSWVLWSAQHLRKLCMQIAASRQFVVVNVEYGLAPEHPWPWAVEDAIYALRWTTSNIEQYGGIPDPLFVGGDSAGANLSASAICGLQGSDLTEIDEGDLKGVDVSFGGALLLYGVFDFPLLFAEPGTNAGTGFIETTWNLAYLGPNFVSRHRHPLVSPSYVDTLAAFPPTYLSCGADDALLPQTLRFGKQLIDAGVPTTMSIVAEADHSFLLMPEVVTSARAELERLKDWLADHAARSTAQRS